MNSVSMWRCAVQSSRLLPATTMQHNGNFVQCMNVVVFLDKTSYMWELSIQVTMDQFIRNEVLLLVLPIYHHSSRAAPPTTHGLWPLINIRHTSIMCGWLLVSVQWTWVLFCAWIYELPAFLQHKIHIPTSSSIENLQYGRCVPWSFSISNLYDESLWWMITNYYTLLLRPVQRKARSIMISTTNTQLLRPESGITKNYRHTIPSAIKALLVRIFMTNLWLA